ncbi:MAG TPA: hypothetical protein PLY25_10775 [Bacteroidia bacterium]|nr:hypothetical protein [Bacteroidia bacterium]
MEITFKAQNETTKEYIESDSILQNKESKEAYLLVSGDWVKVEFDTLQYFVGEDFFSW